MVKNGVKVFRYFGFFLVLGVIFGPVNNHFFLKCYNPLDFSKVVTYHSENIKICVIYGD